MVMVQPETYREKAGTVGRVPDAQMQRGAMPYSCQKLVGATFYYTVPSAPPTSRPCSTFTHQTGPA